MLIKKEELEKLPSAYSNEIEKFIKQFAKVKFKNAPRIKLFTEFSENYIMLPKLWDEYFIATYDIISTSYSSPSQIVYYCSKEFDKLRIRSRKHFYGNKIKGNSDHGFVKLLHESPTLYHEFVDFKHVKYELSLPRKDIDKTWRYIKEYSSSPLPKEMHLLYKKSEALYDKIIAAGNNTEEWFQLIAQVEDKEYVCNNAEYKLGNDLTNIQLWKLYLQYLEKHDTRRLLYVYSCYCRFFLDDVEMKEKYKTACQKYGPSIVHWKNLFDFEKYEEEKITDEDIEIKRKKEDDEPDRPVLNEVQYNAPERRIQDPQLTKADKICVKNYRNQVFAFPKTTMLRIAKSENSDILHKLHQCCKYFFFLMPYTACHSIIVTESSPSREEENYIEFYEQSAWISFGDKSNFSPPKLIYDRKFTVSNTFHCLTSQPTILSEFLPNIFLCNVKHVHIKDQHFTLKEFKFLSGLGNIETLSLSEVKLVYDGKNEEIELQETLQLTPKIIELEMTQPTISEQTFEILAGINFKNKFEIFKLDRIIYLEPVDFSKFLKKNLAQKSKCSVNYCYETVSNAVARKAIKIIENELKYFWQKDEEPRLEIYHSGQWKQGFYLGQRKYEEEKITDEDIEIKRKKEDDEPDRPVFNEVQYNTPERRIQEPQLRKGDKICVKNYRNQVFAFPKTTMLRIAKSENPDILHKLHQCCKYFFFLMPYTACHSIIVTESSPSREEENYIEFYEQSAWISYGDRRTSIPSKLIYDRKFTVSNTFHCLTSQQNILSEFLPNIFLCNVKHVHIKDQHFTLKEFKFLSGLGNIETVCFRHVELVYDGKNEEVELQEILQLTPKITEFKTEETVFNNCFNCLTNDSYFQKNLAPKSICSVYYCYETVSKTVTQKATKVIENELKEHWKKDEEPKLEIYHSAQWNQRFVLGQEVPPATYLRKR